ncbi:YceI family protein [Streptomyces sp. NBC_00669]|uniref:YceI family protein n=1 Tax=Streptomyces sp. NBC_00669 TaxID=2976011 RepID=UPI002E314A5E|nr:YceI family protein [Streptomyces sp. NBC_00669]
MTRATAVNPLTTGTGAGHWVLGSRAGSVRFAHRLMGGLLTVRGGFAVTGDVTVSPDGSVTGTLRIDSASIDTRNRKRDLHLRSADFLDVARYPEILVVIDSAAVSGDEVELRADIRVKGIRERQRLHARITDVSGDKVAVALEVAIDRHRFGITWNRWGMVRGSTLITVDAVLTRAA